jgi:hypothetical protein
MGKNTPKKKEKDNFFILSFRCETNAKIPPIQAALVKSKVVLFIFRIWHEN